ncbi:inositol monophosphatase family protein [Streptomyces sp. NPDC087532]|uniref:inositol monophosphatase family protein n=1 Tax=Streptomyces sp. NPDC087532 TaxID=3365795 RepID=UPI00382537D8
MTELSDLLRVAAAAVDEAAGLVKAMTLEAVEAKGERDMVTNIDLAVEDRVRTFLSRETPEIGFYGEEGGATGTQGRSLTWVLDPVDGTANLTHGIRLCGVSLGLVQRQEAVAGVIDLPFLEERYSAARGLGAVSRSRQLQVRTSGRLDEAIVGIGDYAVGLNAEEKNKQRFALTQLLAEEVLRIRMLGSAAIDLCWVASGRLDACIALSNHPWDMAAGVVIAREAGAVVMDLDGSEHNLASTATIAVTPSLQGPLISLLSRLRSSPSYRPPVVGDAR